MIVLLCSCGQPSNSPSSGSGSLYINSIDDREIAAITISGNSINIQSGDQNMAGVVKKDKRKYYDGSQLKYVIKFGDDGFKLRDHNEQLLWKVKYYEDKIKVGDNEEMRSAHEIKLRDGGKIKLERNDSHITDYHVSDDKEGWVNIEEEFKIKGFGQSLASGILLIHNLKQDEKNIIMAELMAAGR